MVKIGRQKTRPNTLVSASSVRWRTLAEKVYSRVFTINVQGLKNGKSFVIYRIVKGFRLVNRALIQILLCLYILFDQIVINKDCMSMPSIFHSGVGAGVVSLLIVGCNLSRFNMSRVCLNGGKSCEFIHR